MKNFTQKFIGLLALVFAMSFTVNSQAQNNINLPQGWSMFGYNCEEPQEATPALHEIVDKIVIVKDHFGNAYLPELDFNGIGDFTNGVGYQIKMIEQVDGFQFCSSVLPDDGIGQADLDAVQTELAIALESLSDLTEQMGEIELSYSGEDILYISEFVNSLLLDVSTLLDSDALDLNSLTELAENYLTPGIAYLTDNSLVTDEEVSLLYDILFDIAALVANQEDGITQVDVDAAYADGAASVTPEDGITQADVDAAIASYAGWCASDIDNDGVCDIDEVSGCVESNACNYNVNATDDDGSCAFAFAFYDCSGLCLNDDNDNNICDELEVFGCMNETSCNYNELANMDDGSCEGLLGCTVELFSEFNPDATCDDESCEIVYACMDEASPNYQPWVLQEAMMYGGFAIHDDSMCGQEGCMIEQGCNYDPSNEFGSTDLCEFPEEGFDCNGNIFNINELQIGDYHAGGIVYILNDDGTGWVVNPIQNTVWMNQASYSDFINQANSNINYETNGDYGDWQLAGYNDYVTLSELFGPLSSELPGLCAEGDYSWGFNDVYPNIMSDSQASFYFCNGTLQDDIINWWWVHPNVNYRLVRAF